MHKNVPAYIREGGKIPNLGGEKYYLVYYPDIGKWYIQNDEEKLCFLKKGQGGHMHIRTKGKYHMFMFKAYFVIFILETNPLNLNSAWVAASGDNKWENQATVKIFSDEKKFGEYQKTLKKE